MALGSPRGCWGPLRGHEGVGGVRARRGIGGIRGS